MSRDLRDTTLGTLGGYSSTAYGINDSGQVVGGAYTSGNVWHAFLYSNGTMQDLGTLGGTVSEATAINASGQVVGRAWTSGNGALHAFLYDGTMHDLGTLGYGTNSGAWGINDSGQVVGESAGYAFLYNGWMQGLGTLGYGSGYSMARAINASGQIVGEAAMANPTVTGAYRAFLCDPMMRDLGTLGGTFSQAFGINASGQVVGMASTSGDAAYHPFLYDGTMHDLNSLIAPGSGLTLERVTAINDCGQIVATSTNGQSYLLTPIPEPATLSLVGLGLAALVARRRGTKK